MSPMLLGGLAGGGAVLLLGLLSPKKLCPRCQTPFPKFRLPTNGKQAMKGGWTCKQCGLECDKHGKALEPVP